VRHSRVSQRINQVVHALLRDQPADEQQLGVVLACGEGELVGVDPARNDTHERIRRHRSQVAGHVLARGEREIGVGELEGQILRLGVNVVAVSDEGNAETRQSRGHDGMGRSASSKMGVDVPAAGITDNARDLGRVPKQRAARQHPLPTHERKRARQAGEVGGMRDSAARADMGQADCAVGEGRVGVLPRLRGQRHRNERDRVSARLHGADLIADEGF